jgi:hypothetical protein
MFIKTLHIPHGEKFTAQQLLEILQNKNIVINTHGKETIF